MLSKLYGLESRIVLCVKQSRKNCEDYKRDAATALILSEKGSVMFNQYLELTPENADISMANVVLENLKFIVISLDQIFRGHAGEDYYDEEYTFYFYHLQNTLTSWGAVINMISSGLNRQKPHNVRARHLCEVFNINPAEYKWLFNKSFRNAGAHADERYDLFGGRAGDYNVLSTKTPEWMREEILTCPHIRTLDTKNWIYLTYNRNGRQICCNLQELGDEAYMLLYQISTHPRFRNAKLTHIPTKELLK